MQIVGYMIASIQENYEIRKAIFPPRMLGIMMTKFKLMFCSLELSENYLKELYHSFPNNNIGTFRLSRTYDIRNDNDRLNAFEQLVVLRRYLSE